MMKKRIFLTLLAAMVLLSAITGVSAGAASVAPVGETAIAIDGDLTEWADVKKLPMNEVTVDATNGNSMAASATDYVQFQYENGMLYYAVTVADSTDEINGDNNLKRDHIRVSVILPDGSIGVFHDDNDGWLMIDSNLAEWWGLGSAATFTNSIDALNDQTGTFGQHKYNADGTLTYEGRLKFKDATAIQSGASLRVAVSFFANYAVNGNVFDGDKWSCYGVSNVNDVPTTPDEVVGVVQLGAPATVLPLGNDTVTIDGSLTEWADTAKLPMNEVTVDATNGNSMAASATDYVQFRYEDGMLYYAVTVADSTDKLNNNGLDRDHIRIAVILPDGSIGVFYNDNDVSENSVTGWINTDNAMAEWWGLGPITNSVATQDLNGTYAMNKYNADGTLTFEGRIKFNDAAAAQVKEGAELRVAVSYFGKFAVNANVYNGEKWSCYGVSNVNDVPLRPVEIVGHVELGAVPTTPIPDEGGNGDNEPADPVVYEAVAPLGGNELDINWSEPEYWEWEDDADGLWTAPEKYPLDVYDAATGKWVKSETEFIQFKYSYGMLYFRMYTKDSNGENVMDSSNALVRDRVLMSVVFPNGEHAYFGWCSGNSASSDYWNEWGVISWFDPSFEAEQSKELNAATNDMTMACMTWKDGYVDIEGRINVKDACRDYFVHGTELKVAVSYASAQTVNSAELTGTDFAKWGSSDITCMFPENISGVVTLSDPSYRDLTDMEVIEETTTGAVNKGYGFDADGNLIVKVEAVEGAAAYRVNVFDRWGDDYLANTWEESESTTITVSGLIEDVDSTYQVVAYDADGEIVAVYPAVDFVVGVEPEEETTTPGTGDDITTGEGNDDNAGGNGTTVDDGKTDEEADDPIDAPDMGDALPFVAMALLAASSGTFVLTAKKRK